MKKQPLCLLILITLLFSVFILGFFLGRNQNRETIQVSAVSAEPRHDLPPETHSPTEAAAAEVSFAVNINTAGITELTALPGIGETLAQRILEYRNSYGAYVRPEELLNVDGIGAGKLEAILDYIITGG